jgi:hypothetical protein
MKKIIIFLISVVLIILIFYPKNYSVTAYPGVYPPIKDLEKATVLPTRMLSEDEITRWAAEFKKIFFA